MFLLKAGSARVFSAINCSNEAKPNSSAFPTGLSVLVLHVVSERASRNGREMGVGDRCLFCLSERQSERASGTWPGGRAMLLLHGSAPLPHVYLIYLGKGSNFFLSPYVGSLVSLVWPSAGGLPGFLRLAAASGHAQILKPFESKEL